MTEAVRELKYFSKEEADRYWPDMIEKAEHDRATMIYCAEERGREEGIKEGIKEGLLEGKKKIALEMLKENFPMDTIIKITGLSKEDILALKDGCSC